MESFEARIETEEKTPLAKKEWFPPTRKKIKTGNTQSSNSIGGPTDGGIAPVAYDNS